MAHNGRKNSQPQDLQRQEGDGKCLWNLSEQVPGTTGHHAAKVKVVRNIVYTCVVLHNIMRTYQGGADRASNPGNNGEGPTK